jgi:hypothetical protein
MMSNSRWGKRQAMVLGLGVAVAVSIWLAAAGSSTAHGQDASSTAASSSAATSSLDTQLAIARIATAKYANDLGRAKEDGYQIITRMLPNMGYHFMNPSVKGFDLHKPPILVYEHRGDGWQLGALEWVFASKPAHPPLPGASYGAFGAGCHYTDGTFVPADAQSKCPKTSPQTGKAFTFWHPTLVTMHVWVWYPNSSGLFSSTNPLVAPFNHG